MDFRSCFYDTEETAALSPPHLWVLSDLVQPSFEAHSTLQHYHPVLKRTEKLFSSNHRNDSISTFLLTQGKTDPNPPEENNV